MSAARRPGAAPNRAADPQADRPGRSHRPAQKIPTTQTLGFRHAASCFNCARPMTLPFDRPAAHNTTAPRQGSQSRCQSRQMARPPDPFRKTPAVACGESPLWYTTGAWRRSCPADRPKNGKNGLSQIIQDARRGIFHGPAMAPSCRGSNPALREGLAKVSQHLRANHCDSPRKAAVTLL
jgi:hypothetical protein